MAPPVITNRDREASECAAMDERAVAKAGRAHSRRKRGVGYASQ
jgi:hypothetical protein